VGKLLLNKVNNVSIGLIYVYAIDTELDLSQH